jgi:hypothetical protein
MIAEPWTSLSAAFLLWGTSALDLDVRCARIGRIVRKELFIPIRCRRDGSVYFHKKHPIWSALGETVTIALFIVIALVLLVLAILQSSAVHAHKPNGPAATSAMTPIGFSSRG